MSDFKSVTSFVFLIENYTGMYSGFFRKTLEKPCLVSFHVEQMFSRGFLVAASVINLKISFLLSRNIVLRIASIYLVCAYKFLIFSQN